MPMVVPIHDELRPQVFTEGYNAMPPFLRLFPSRHALPSIEATEVDITGRDRQSAYSSIQYMTL